MFYHLTSRCVRRSHLCGRRGKRDFSHRKQWLVDRILQLGQAFSIEIHAYAIMSNHFHLVVYYDPTESQSWTAEEVANRWFKAFPLRTRKGLADEKRLSDAKIALIEDTERLQQARSKLGSQATFMQMLKQPIARRANREDGCEGHFFDQRYYSGALLSKEAILAAMAYVDLNPIRAKIAKTLEDSEFTSLAKRIRKHKLELPMRPIVSGILKPRFAIKIALIDYVLRVEAASKERANKRMNRWRQQIAMIRKKQRAYGTESQLAAWITERNM